MSFDDLNGGPFESNFRRPNLTPPPKKPPLNINVVKSTSATFYGAITLDQLRAFVEACTGLNGSAKVDITKYAGDQRDGSSTTIKVSDA